MDRPDCNDRCYGEPCVHRTSTRRRPHYEQSHPAMRVARNIVNQILDEAGTDVATRQRINDDCDQFAALLLDRYAHDVVARVEELR